MSILVTGAGGFVGGAIVRRLLEQGDSVVALIRDYSDKWATRLPQTERMVIAFGSVEDVDGLYRLLIDHNVSRVFHLAAQSIVAKCQLDPLSAWRSNVLGTVGVLEAVRRAPWSVRVVTAATDKVYGFGAVPYHETQPLLGLETYPATKVAADIAARSYAHTYGVDVSVVRSCNVYGPGDNESSRLIPGSIQKMLRGETATLWDGAANMIREFVYIDDEVDAYFAVADEGTPGEAYNVHGSGPVRVQDVMETLAELCGGRVQIEQRDVKEIPVQYMDGAKVESLGWSPKVGLRAGLERTVKWFRSELRVEVTV